MIRPPLVEPRATLVPASEVAGRLTGLQAGLAARGLEAALIVQNADLYYFSGTVQRSFLYVPAVGEATLFVRKLAERARLETPLEGIVELASPRDLPGLIARRYGAVPGRLGVELDVLPVTEYRRLEKLFPEAAFEDVGRDIVRQRAVKSAWEVERIRAAAAIVLEVCELIPGILREGLTEAAFAGLVEAEARRLGHEGIIRMRGFNQEMFYGQILTGVSGSAASYLDTPLAGTGLSPAVAQGVSFKPIRRGDHVVFDFVPVREGYIADFTRIFVLGDLPGELRHAYEAAVTHPGGRGRGGAAGRHLPPPLRDRARGRRRRGSCGLLHGARRRAGAVHRARRGAGARRAARADHQRPGARRGDGVRARAQVRVAGPWGHRRREHVAGRGRRPRAAHRRSRAHPSGRLSAPGAG